MQPDRPETYPRRVLLSVSGLTPQVITETLYALAMRSPPFVPTEVHVITTDLGRQRFVAHINQFRQFFQEYELPVPRCDAGDVHVIAGADGRSTDVRTPRDNEHVANLVMHTVLELTSDPQCAVHASIAGGRKTMGFYLGYLMSMFGRDQADRAVGQPFRRADIGYDIAQRRLDEVDEAGLARRRMLGRADMESAGADRLELLLALCHPVGFGESLDGQLGPNTGTKRQTIARLFGGDEQAWAAFDPRTVIDKHGPYPNMAAWLGVSDKIPAEHHAAGNQPPSPAELGDWDNYSEEHAANARKLCLLLSGHNVECSVVGYGGAHDFAPAGAAFASALPWLAGRLGTPEVPRIPLPGAG